MPSRPRSCDLAHQPPSCCLAPAWNVCILLSWAGITGHGSSAKALPMGSLSACCKHTELVSHIPNLLCTPGSQGLCEAVSFESPGLQHQQPAAEQSAARIVAGAVECSLRRSIMRSIQVELHAPRACVGGRPAAAECHCIQGPLQLRGTAWQLSLTWPAPQWFPWHNCACQQLAVDSLCE